MQSSGKKAKKLIEKKKKHFQVFMEYMKIMAKAFLHHEVSSECGQTFWTNVFIVFCIDII